MLLFVYLFTLVCFVLVEVGTGPEEERTLAPCYEAAEGVCYQPSTPQLPCVPHLLTPPPRQAGLALHQAVSRPCLISRRLLSAHPSVDKWPAGWLLVTPAWRGPSSQSCVWQFGLEPTVGGLPVEEAQPSPASGASNPRTTPWLGHAVPRTHRQAREPRPSRPPVLARFGSRPSNVGEGWSCRSH